jgi:baculoviral IAP repeat-containing protein 6
MKLTKIYGDFLRELQKLPDKQVLSTLHDNEIMQCIQSSLDDMTPSTIDSFCELYENIIHIILLMPSNMTQVFKTSIQRINIFINSKSCALKLLPHEKEMLNSFNEIVDNPVQETYETCMSKYRFGEADIVNKGYYSGYLSNISCKLLPSAIKRISCEITSLAVDLPINKTSSIFVRVDPSNMSVMRAMIIGPKDTPYENGCFIFDIKIPSNYPKQHPDIHFMNHGNVRFNPNLYNCGKVCLSLIGTWGDRQQNNSENWQPDTSTIFQLLLSVQSQILVEKPYFNEPAYYGKESESVRESTEYNRAIEYYTLQHAITGLLKSPIYGEFNDIVKEHFKLNAPEIKAKYKNLYHDKNEVLYKQCVGLLDELK